MNYKMLIGLAAIPALAACGGETEVHNNTTVVENTTENSTGGPCGDGTVLNQGEVCR